MDIEELLCRLFSMTYESARITRELPVIMSSLHEQTEKVVREWAREQDNDKDKIIASLEAKVTVYEKIIGNSNFGPLIAPIVEEPKTDNEFMRGDEDECNT